jgi:hypothetical protein
MDYDKVHLINKEREREGGEREREKERERERYFEVGVFDHRN